MASNLHPTFADILEEFLKPRVPNVSISWCDDCQREVEHRPEIDGVFCECGRELRHMRWKEPEVDQLILADNRKRGIDPELFRADAAVNAFEADRELIRRLVAALEIARNGYITSGPTALIIDAALAAAKERP